RGCSGKSVLIRWWHWVGRTSGVPHRSASPRAISSNSSVAPIIFQNAGRARRPCRRFSFLAMALLSRKEGDLPKRSLWQRIKDIALTDVGVLARGGVSTGSLEQIEEILLQAD